MCHQLLFCQRRSFFDGDVICTLHFHLRQAKMVLDCCHIHIRQSGEPDANWTGWAFHLRLPDGWRPHGVHRGNIV